MKLCMGCMNYIEDNVQICSHCGYNTADLSISGGHLPPETILNAQYVVGRKIGQGGFGITYIGWDAGLEHKIAIKEYFPQVLCSRRDGETEVYLKKREVEKRYQNGLKEFIREAQRIARLEDIDGIVHIYNCFAENKTGYIIMEYMEGQDLRMYLKQNNILTYDQACTVMAPVLKTLNEVHRYGIIHRDIAPDNIYVTVNGEIKLLDFGAARHAAAGEKQEEIFLKKGYAPVEQYDLNGKQGPWTDVYAAAAVFYRVLTGIKPIESVGRKKDGKDSLQSLSQMGVVLPKQGEAIMMQALSIDPDRRPQSMEEFIKGLHGTWKYSPIVEKPVREEETDPQKPQKRSKAMVITAASLGALALAGGIFAAVSFGSRDDKEVVVATNISEEDNKMPELSGKTQEQAEKLLESLGIDMGQVSYEYEYTPDLSEIDMVTGQEPRSGLPIVDEANQTVPITVKLSGLEEKVTLPDLCNQSEASVKRTLKDFMTDEAVRNVKINEILNNDANKQELIVDQSIPEGEIYAVNEDTLVLTKVVGTVDEYTVKVPNLVGQDYRKVSVKAKSGRKTKKSYPFDNNEERKINLEIKQTDSAEPKGRILKQSVEGGEKLNTFEDSTLVLYVSKWNKKVKVPDLNGMQRSTALQKLRDEGFKVSITEQESESIEKGTIISFSPGKAKKGTTVHLVVSTGKKKEEKPKEEPKPDKPNHPDQNSSEKNSPNKNNLNKDHSNKQDDMVSVPNLIGMTKSEARAALANAGLSLGKVDDTIITDHVGVGEVDSYSPKGRVKKGTSINVDICSANPDSDVFDWS